MSSNRYNKYNGIYLGIVKENKDFQSMGRLDVSIPELGSPDSVIHVGYVSPFAGTTNISENDPNNTETYEGTQKSYGFWAVPPDIGVMVMVCFVNGDPSRGYWFGNPISQYMNHMIPNIPVGENYQYEDAVPVAEYNKNDSSPSKHKGKRPFHRPHYEGIRNQGLKADKKRGFSQNGCRSGTPSKVMGMLSPKGHYWSIEDTEDDEKIRIRTRSGVQLLLDETEGFVYIINKTGSAWLELAADGKILMYSDDSFAVRAKQDIVMRADRDLYLDAGRNIVMKSAFNTQIDTANTTIKTTEKFVVDSASDVSLRSAKLDVETSADANLLVNGAFAIGSDDLNINSGGNLMLTSSANIDMGAGGNLTLSGSGNASLSGSGNVIVAGGGSLGLGGGTVGMNMGASAIMAGAAKAASPSTVTLSELPLNSKVDIVQPPSDDDPEEIEVETISPLFPTHEPYPERNH